MTLAALYMILPVVLLAVTAVGVMLSIAVRRSHTMTAVLSLVGLIASLVALLGPGSALPRPVTSLFVVDGPALYFIALLLVAALCVVVFAYGYLGRQSGNREEFYILLVLATLGAAVLVLSNHLASLFLGLEILSVALYGLIAYLRTRRLSIEAGLKYLVLAAASAAFMLFGMALVYAATGTMEFERIASAMSSGSYGSNTLLQVGIAMTLVGVGFKLGVVPFHMWTPDVYQGAPAPISAFVASVSKGAVLVLALRYLGAIDLWGNRPLLVALTSMSIASMFAGNLLALLQNSVKRILAYSSIAHLGYLLVAFVAGGELGSAAVAFYLVAYFATTLGAFGVVSALSGSEGDADARDVYQGLFWRRPLLASLFTLMLLSLAGIPLTAGFFAKFYVLSAGVSTLLWLLTVSLAISSVIGLYYYLRLIVTLFLPAPDKAERADTISLSWVTGTVLALLALAVLWLGVYPTWLINVIQSVTSGFWG
jgi:NADH-quinone oxidoreductase subunit N